MRWGAINYLLLLLSFPLKGGTKRKIDQLLIIVWLGFFVFVFIQCDFFLYGVSPACLAKNKFALEPGFFCFFFGGGVCYFGFLGLLVTLEGEKKMNVISRVISDAGSLEEEKRGSFFLSLSVKRISRWWERTEKNLTCIYWIFLYLLL